ncbi:MAG: amino acid racemase [Flavobacteriaceae bacterium]
MKTIGLIGGTSWHSTLDYYRLINSLVSDKIGTSGNPPLILYSLNIEIMRSQDWEKINQKYLEVARILHKAGAQAIVICANTPHTVYDFVQPQIEIPILHIADAIGKYASKNELETLGLLGNKPTMTGEFIPSYLDAHYKIKSLIPEAMGIDRSHYFVSKELTRGIFSDEAREFYLSQIDLLQKRGAEGVILGCTELPILLSQEDSTVPLIPTTDLHAQMAADFILS